MFGCPKRRESFWVNAFLLIEEETLGIVQCKRFSKEEHTMCYLPLNSIKTKIGKFTSKIKIPGWVRLIGVGLGWVNEWVKIGSDNTLFR